MIRYLALLLFVSSCTIVKNNVEIEDVKIVSEKAFMAGQISERCLNIDVKISLEGRCEDVYKDFNTWWYKTARFTKDGKTVYEFNRKLNDT